MSTKQEPKTGEVKTESVVLKAAHKHAGVQYQEGDKIDVSQIDKDWLIAQKMIADPTGTAAVAAASKE